MAIKALGSTGVEPFADMRDITELGHCNFQFLRQRRRALFQPGGVVGLPRSLILSIKAKLPTACTTSRGRSFEQWVKVPIIFRIPPCKTHPLVDRISFERNTESKMYRPTSIENLAIQARLNFILGAREYDGLFIGFECGHIQGKTAHVFARSEHNAHQIGSRYSTHVAIAVESVIKRPIKTVHVLPRHFSDSRPEI